LQRSLNAGGPELVSYAKHYSHFDRLRSDPPFQRLLDHAEKK
jgi:hypothetical protein